MYKELRNTGSQLTYSPFRSKATEIRPECELEQLFGGSQLGVQSRTVADNCESFRNTISRLCRDLPKTNRCWCSDSRLPCY